jgi:6-phosphofructokinase 1
MADKKICVLTSGGDAPGMNACVRAVVKCGEKRGLEVYGARRGYQGLIENEFIRLERSSVSNIIQKGGSIIVSSRSEYFFKEDGRKTAADNLRNMGIEGLIVIGGNGSMTGAYKMMLENGTKIVGVPGTIDRDIWGTEETIGFNTAVNTALESIDRIRDTAEAMERVFIIEVMGRHCGEIALISGIGGGADAVMIPEVKTDIDELIHDIQEGSKQGKKTNLIVVAEGDDFGGAHKVSMALKERAGIKSWVVILGYVQRGGTPTAIDRYFASVFGVAAVDTIVEGMSGVMVGWQKDEVKYIPLKDTFSNKKPFDPHDNELLELLT